MTREAFRTKARALLRWASEARGARWASGADTEKFHVVAGHSDAEAVSWPVSISVLCSKYPALRELLLVWRKRPDLQSLYPFSGPRDVEALVKWGLVSGVNGNPALAELSSDLSLAANACLDEGDEPDNPRAPTTVHLVSLADFPRSFRNCADALEKELKLAGLTVIHHRQADNNVLAALATSLAADRQEVVHVVGQGDVSALLNSRKWVLTIHGAAPYSLPTDLHPPPGPVLDALRHEAARIPAVICPSFNARREISIAYGIPIHRIHPIPHFFDQKTFCPEGATYELNTPYFLLVSDYQPKKNYRAVFEALNELIFAKPDMKLVLLVVGTPNSDLLQLVEESYQRWPVLVDRIRLLGYMEEIAQLYRGAIALLSLSHQEGFGMPYIEAALCGTPIIGPKRSSVAAAWTSQPTQEILNSAGLYVSPQDPSELATLMYILACDNQLRKAVGVRCLIRAREYIDPKFLLSRYMRVYADILRSGCEAYKMDTTARP